MEQLLRGDAGADAWTGAEPVGCGDAAAYAGADWSLEAIDGGRGEGIGRGGLPCSASAGECHALCVRGPCSFFVGLSV